MSQPKKIYNVKMVLDTTQLEVKTCDTTRHNITNMVIVFIRLVNILC